jgi:outer membrane protein OmpA-like peptidoglycan-associated protein
VVRKNRDGYDRERTWSRRAVIAGTLALAVAAPIYMLRSNDNPSSTRFTVANDNDDNADNADTIGAVTVAQEPPIPPTTAGATSSSEFPSTTSITTTMTTTYPMLPDGTPEPVVAIFDNDVIVLTGMVPTQEASTRLESLVVANSKTPAEVVNYLLVNPVIPLNVAVRFIELNSVRFPPATAEVTPDHATELDRIAGLMNLLPNVTALVVGHADQRGSETANFALSAARAQAVVNYLISVGIAPSRLSLRGVGETDPLANQEDELALELNRRTEFIFSGVLIG